MHYLGMAAMIMPDTMSYSPVLLVLSVVIAVVAGTVALWIGTWVRGIGATIGAALVMGVAVSGMHYTGMAAMHVHPGAMANMPMAGGGASPVAFLFPLVLGISVLTVIMTLTITMSPSEEEIREDIAMRERMELLQQRTESGDQRTRPRSGGIRW